MCCCLARRARAPPTLDFGPPAKKALNLLQAMSMRLRARLCVLASLLLVALVGAVAVNGQAGSEEGGAPLWEKDMKQHDKLEDAVHDHEEMSSTLGDKDSGKQAEAGHSPRQVSRLEQRGERSGSPKAGKAHSDADAEELGEAAHIEEQHAGDSTDGETSRRAADAHQPQPKQPRELGSSAETATKKAAPLATEAPTTELGAAAPEEKTAEKENPLGKAAAAKPTPYKGAKGDKPQYDDPGPGAPPKTQEPTPAPTPAIPEGFIPAKKAEIDGYPIKPNLSTFMYYGRMVSLYLFNPDLSKERKFLKVSDGKMILDSVGQDMNRKMMSFKLHRALAYTGSEPYGAKPFCYSFQVASEPSKWLTIVRDTYFSVTTIEGNHKGDIGARRQASFCIADKKEKTEFTYAISLTAWHDPNMVWRAVGKYASLGEFVPLRKKSFTPRSATFVVVPALFHGLCWAGLKKKCACEKSYSGDGCHLTKCKDQKSMGKMICSNKGICDPRTFKCGCGEKNFGSDCQHKKCPTWGDGKDEKTCNHRGQCDTKKATCRRDAG